MELSSCSSSQFGESGSGPSHPGPTRQPAPVSARAVDVMGGFDGSTLGQLAWAAAKLDVRRPDLWAAIAALVTLPLRHMWNPLVSPDSPSQDYVFLFEQRNRAYADF